MKITVRPDTDPRKLAARTLAVIDSTNVLWERRRSAMRVIVTAAQIIASERSDVGARKIEGSELVHLWSESTGRQPVAYLPRGAESDRYRLREVDGELVAYPADEPAA